MTYILLVVFRQLVNLLPRRIAISLGIIVGSLWYIADRRHRRVAKSNMTYAFLGEKNHKEINRLAPRCFSQIGINFIEFLRCKKFFKQSYRKYFTIEGLENVNEAIKKQKGAIVIAAHFGNWELMSILAPLAGLKATTVAAPIRNKRVQDYLKKMRTSAGMELVFKKDASKALLSRLRNNESVVIFIDQSAGVEGVWIDFFNRKASTTGLPALLVLKTGAKVLSVFLIRNSRYRYKLIFEKPFEIKNTGNLRKDLHSNTQNFTNMIEKYVRKYPDHWFWVHRRWKPSPVRNAVKPFQRIENILIKETNWIGDVIMTLPALEYIKKLFPQTRISVLIKQEIADLLKNNPFIDEIIPYHHRLGFRGLIDKLKTIKDIRHRYFALAVIFPNSFESALWMFAARIPMRLGANTDGRGILLTHKIPPRTANVHQLDYFRQIARALGKSEITKHPKTYVAQDEKKWAENFLRQHGIDSQYHLVGINPGAAYGPAKRWLPERFAELSTKLIENQRAQIIIFGDEKEVELSNFIQNRIKNNVLNLCGKTTLAQLSALIEKCSVFVTNDTGPMHLAASLGTKVVAIFGSTSPFRTSPTGDFVVLKKDVECSPCFKRECPADMKCMTAITVEDVYEKVINFLQNKESNELL